MRKPFISLVALFAMMISLAAQRQAEGGHNATWDFPNPGPARDVTIISFAGSEFVNAFNAADGTARLVVVFSPT